MTRDVLTENEEIAKTFRIVRFDEPGQNEPKSSRQALSVDKKREKEGNQQCAKKMCELFTFPEGKYIICLA